MSNSSFLQFFTPKLGPKDGEEEMTIEEEDMLDSIEEDYMLAVEIVDEIIPLALEYYLNIVEQQIDEQEYEDLDEGEVDQEIIDGEEVSGGLLIYTSIKKHDEKMDDEDSES